ncbi:MULTISPECIES: hypothetical protein [unclassified Streptomyces]|uniref:MFS transporter small subunit n=1 Tax=unclassified Streptomyces TaxID=2593676 RepID=UPI0037F44D5A
MPHAPSPSSPNNASDPGSPGGVSDPAGTSGSAGAGGTGGRRPLIVFAWLWVVLPLGYGLYELVQKATRLFTG